MVLERVFHQADDASDAGHDAQTKDDQGRQAGKVQVQRVPDGADDRHVKTEDEQHGGAGNAGQYHGADGYYGGCEDIDSEGQGKLRYINAGSVAGHRIQKREKEGDGNARDEPDKVPFLF